MTDDEFRDVQVIQMRADIDLKRKQSFCETPKAIALIVATTATIAAAVFGVLGYKIGSAPPQTINVHLDAPLTVGTKAAP